MTARHGWQSDFWHHLMVAVVVASALSLLHHTHLLGWLDSMMLRIVSSAQSVGGAEGDGIDANAPAVLLIGNDLYEKEFNQASPLDRGKLADVIEAIAAQSPSVLAIDIDLSPGPEAMNSGQKRLDAVLDAIIAKPGLRLVLITPLPVATDGLTRLKYAYMKRLCDKGVHFALPEVLLSRGEVLRYDPNAPTLGQVTVHEERDDMCRKLGLGYEHATFLRLDHPGESALDNFFEQRPFNARYFLAESDVIHTLTNQAEMPDNLANRPVFLGVGFGKQDTFMTAFGEVKGVMLHAASYYSSLPKHRIDTDRKVLAFSIDVIIGLFAGYLFHWSWCRYRLATERLNHWTTSRKMVQWFMVAKFWLLGNFVMLAAAVVSLVWLGAWAYRANIWIDPGPMILGVFIKTLLGSYIQPNDAHADFSLQVCQSHHSSKFVSIANGILGLGIVLWALISLFVSSH